MDRQIDRQWVIAKMMIPAAPANKGIGKNSGERIIEVPIKCGCRKDRCVKSKINNNRNDRGPSQQLQP